VGIFWLGLTLRVLVELEVVGEAVGGHVHHRGPVLLKGRDGQVFGLLPAKQVPERIIRNLSYNLALQSIIKRVSWLKSSLLLRIDLQDIQTLQLN
jgi:hypothetical protein